MIKQMMLVNSTENGSTDYLRYTVVSRTRDVDGFPINDCHTIWESFPSAEIAMKYAAVRNNDGYWVDVFENIAYNIVQCQ